VAIEAMACGTPVVASDLPGVRKVIAESGVLVPPGDAALLASALRQVIEDDALRQRLVTSGQDRVQARFKWDRHVDGLLDAYRAVVKH
jgi:glycosyltransferase involved in cell wall biosynthesis